MPQTSCNRPTCTSAHLAIGLRSRPPDRLKSAGSATVQHTRPLTEKTIKPISRFDGSRYAGRPRPKNKSQRIMRLKVELLASPESFDGQMPGVPIGAREQQVNHFTHPLPKMNLANF